MKICKYCGTTYTQNSCPNCGASATVSTTVSEKDRMLQTLYKEKELAKVRQEIAAQKAVQKPKLSSGKKILLILLCILVVVTGVKIFNTVRDNRMAAEEGNDFVYAEPEDTENNELTKENQDSFNYEEVTKQVLEQAKAYLAVGRPEAALKVVSDTMNQHGETPELLFKKEEILIACRQSGLDEVETYAAAGNYVEAIKRLQKLMDVVGTDVELMVKQEAYIAEYKTALFAEAEKLYESKGYIAAVNLLETDELSNDLLAFDTEYQEKLNYYLSRQPVALKDLDVYDGEIVYRDYVVNDAAGDVYQGYFCEGYTIKEATYYLNKEYERFQCKFVMVEAKGDYKREITIKDGISGEVLFSKALSKTEAEGVNIDIDVSGVKFLVISFRGSYEWWSMSDDDSKKAVMVNAQLLRK